MRCSLLSVFLTSCILAFVGFQSFALGQYSDPQIWSIFPNSADAKGVNDGLKSESERKDGDKLLFSRSWRAGSQSRSLSITLSLYPDAKQALKVVRDYGKALGGKGRLSIGDICYWTETMVRPYYMMARGRFVVTVFSRYARGAPVGDQSYLLRLMVSRIDALTRPSSIAVDYPKNLTSPDRFKLRIRATDTKAAPLAGYEVSIKTRNPPSVPKVSILAPEGRLDPKGSFETRVEIAPASGPLNSLGKKMNFIITVFDPKTKKEIANKRISPNLVAAKIKRILPLQAIEGAKLIAEKATGVRIWLDGNSPDCSLELRLKLDSKPISSLTIPEGFAGKSFDKKAMAAAKDSVNLIIPENAITKGEHTITTELSMALRKDKLLASKTVKAKWFPPRNFKILIVATNKKLGDKLHGKDTEGFLQDFGKEVADFLQEIYPVKKVRVSVDPRPLKTAIGLPVVLPGLLKAIAAEDARKAYNKNHSNAPADFVIAVYPSGDYRGITLDKKQGIYYGNSLAGRALSLKRVALVQSDSARASVHEMGHFILEAKDEYILGSKGRAGIYLENVSTFDSRSSSFRYYPKGQDAVYNFMGSYIGSPYKRFWVNKKTFDKLYERLGSLPADPSFIKPSVATKHYLVPIPGTGQPLKRDSLQSISQDNKVTTKKNSLILPAALVHKTKILARAGTVFTFAHKALLLESGALLCKGKQRVLSSDERIEISCDKGSFAIFADRKRGWVVKILGGLVEIKTKHGSMELPAGQGLAIGTDGSHKRITEFDPKEVIESFFSEPKEDPKKDFPWYEDFKNGHR